MQAIMRRVALGLAVLALVGAAGEQPTVKELVDPESAETAAEKPEPEKAPAPGPTPGPADEFNRGVPRTSVEGFQEAAEAEDWERAAEYLHLHGVPRDLKSRGAPQLARDLATALSRALWIDPQALSSDPQGRDEEGLPASREFLGRIETPEAQVDVLLQRVRREDGVLVWKYSNATVAQIPLLKAHFSFGVLGEQLRQVIPARRFLGLPLWEWTGVLLLLSAAVLAAWLGGITIRTLARGTGHAGLASLEARFRGPLRLLLVVIVSRSAAGLLGPTVALRALLEARTLLIIAAAWLAVRIGDVLIERGAARLRRRGQPAANLLGRPARNFARVVIVLLAVVFWLDLLGVRVTTLVAGLGIGGLAVALAAQRPIEDLIGAFTIYSTQAARVGDFCRFGGHMGTVEEIGLRTTRVRTLDDSLLSVPNGEFSKAQVDNLGMRRKIWYHPRVKLRYETTPDQLRCILVEIRKIFFAHPKVIADPARIRFVGFGEYSLDLDVFAYLDTRDYGEYLEIAEDLNLRIMVAVREAGSAFAFPSQVAYLEPSDGLDEERARNAETRVQEWREKGELYLPTFPHTVVEELRGTVSYPPEGSPDAARA